MAPSFGKQASVFQLMQESEQVGFERQQKGRRQFQASRGGVQESVRVWIAVPALVREQRERGVRLEGSEEAEQANIAIFSRFLSLPFYQVKHFFLLSFPNSFLSHFSFLLSTLPSCFCPQGQTDP